MGRNKVKLQVMDTALANVDTQADMSIIEKHKKKSDKRIKLTEPGLIISSANHPINVEYDGDLMRLSPRDKQKVADISKLGKLDKKLILKKL